MDKVDCVNRDLKQLERKVQRDHDDMWSMIASMRAKLKDIEKKMEGENGNL